MKDSFKTLKIALVIALTCLIVSCEKEDDSFVSPEGVWAGEMLMPNGELFLDTLRLEGSVYSNKLYFEVRGDFRHSLGHVGGFSFDEERIVFTPDSVLEGLWQFPNDSIKWTNKDSDSFEDRIEMFGGETFSSLYHIEDDHMILKTDIDNDGNYSLVKEVTTYTKVK